MTVSSPLETELAESFCRFQGAAVPRVALVRRLRSPALAQKWPVMCISDVPAAPSRCAPASQVEDMPSVCATHRCVACAHDSKS